MQWIERVTPLLDADARRFVDDARARVAKEGAKALAELLPSLSRKVGRAGLAPGRYTRSFAGAKDAVVELGVWRACDAVGLALIEESKLPATALLDLHAHGDIEERVILLRAAQLLPIGAITAALLDEVQRSNMQPHFEALVADGNLPARASSDPSVTLDRFNKVMLKAAFNGVAIERLFDVETAANAELSRMLQDLATEREAAGRAVWPGTYVLIGHAPVAGTVARLLGGLEHGDDTLRHAAARGLLALARNDLAPLVRERAAREPRAPIRATSCGKKLTNSAKSSKRRTGSSSRR